jgi:hypothetical protein
MRHSRVSSRSFLGLGFMLHFTLVTPQLPAVAVHQHLFVPAELPGVLPLMRGGLVTCRHVDSQLESGTAYQEQSR